MRDTSPNRLTSAERRYVELLLQGLTTKEIAKLLGVRLSTVYSALDRLSNRWHVSGRKSLIAKALDLRATRPPPAPDRPTYSQTEADDSWDKVEAAGFDLTRTPEFEGDRRVRMRDRRSHEVRRLEDLPSS